MFTLMEHGIAARGRVEDRIRLYSIGIVFAAVAGVLSLLAYQRFVVVPAYRSDVVSMVERQAVSLAHHLLLGFERTDDGSLAEGMHSHLERHLVEGVDSLGLAKFKVFDRDGKVLVSTAAEDVGSYNRNDYFHTFVTAGKQYSKLVRKEGRSLEGEVFDRDVIETYVPIMSDGVFAGAFEFYYDVTATIHDLNRTARRTAAAHIGISTLFIGTIFFFGFRSRSAVREQQVAEETLRAAKAELEAKVRERTDELAAGNLRLLELDELKSVFIASMSHELRTPLNAIIGFTGVLLQGMAGELNDEQRRQLKMVNQNGEHLLKLVNDIIDMSAVESGRVEADIADFDLTRMLMDVRDNFAATAMSRGLQLTLEAATTLPVRNDRRRVLQVINNLVDNAIRYTGKGRVSITAEQKESGVLVAVADTGPGVEAADLERMFEPFRKIRAGRTEDHDGAGIGLYLSRRITTMLGCSLDVESEVGKGTTFYFTVRSS